MKTTRLSFFSPLNLSSLFLPSLTFLLIFCATHVATAQVPSYIPTNGLVGYWPFNGNANDESGNGNNGTINSGNNGTALYSIDRNGNIDASMVLSSNPSWNSLGPYIEILGTNSLVLSSYSITVWIKPSTNCLTGELINKGPDDSGLFSRLQGLAGAAFGSFPNYLDYTFEVSTNEWTMLTFNRNDNSISEIYINGVMLYSLQSSNPSNTDFNIAFGAMPSGGTNGSYYPYQGDLDDIGIWNRALSAEEVLALYNSCNVAPQVVTGSSSPSSFANSTYTCVNNVGSTYTWSVNNGVIANGQGTNSVSILWGAEGVGSVSVVETTADGCVGDVVTFDVVIIPNSIEELSNQLILYPNPATTELNLQITSDLIGTDVFVLDALGKQIFKQQILSTNTIINTSSFAVGNYVVKVGGGVKRFEVVR
jgi:hypothetical protein